MQRSVPRNPMAQRVKGVFIFREEVAETSAKSALEILKSLQCEVLSTRDNRITVSTSRGNLQNIKKCWQSKEQDTDVARKLSQRVEQIIIGGNL